MKLFPFDVTYYWTCRHNTARGNKDGHYMLAKSLGECVSIHLSRKRQWQLQCLLGWIGVPCSIPRHWTPAVSEWNKLCSVHIELSNRVFRNCKPFSKKAWNFKIFAHLYVRGRGVRPVPDYCKVNASLQTIPHCGRSYKLITLETKKFQGFFFFFPFFSFLLFLNFFYAISI